LGQLDGPPLGLRDEGLELVLVDLLHLLVFNHLGLFPEDHLGAFESLLHLPAHKGEVAGRAGHRPLLLVDH
jgi:hypothetical protein